MKIKKFKKFNNFINESETHTYDNQKDITSKMFVQPGIYDVREGDEDGRYYITQETIQVDKKMSYYDLSVQIFDKTGYASPWSYIELKQSEKELTINQHFPLDYEELEKEQLEEVKLIGLQLYKDLKDTGLNKKEAIKVLQLLYKKEILK